MKRAAVFFDRDNTLIVADGYLGDPDGVQLVPGAAAAVAKARQLGYVPVTFSNQSGVARGMFGEDAVRAVNKRLDEMLAADNPAAVIERHEFCPYHPEATVDAYRVDSDLRKPRPGMLLRAAEALNLDLSQSWVVGDAPRDIEAGKAAGCRTVLFRDPQLNPSPAASAHSAARPDFVVASLQEAMTVIESQANTPSPISAADPVPAASPEPATGPALANKRLEVLLEQILQELRRRNEQSSDFSVSRLLAGIVQVIVLAVLFYAYLDRANQASLQVELLLALVLQMLTVALLVMGQQR